jgi:hypothetical protein
MPSLFRRSVALAAVCAAASTAFAQVNVLTHHNDNARSGTNQKETLLSPASVNPNDFGLLFTRAIDGEVYAQPLYVSGLDFPVVGKVNVVFVATMRNSVYAFESDDPDMTAPLWQVNLGPSIPVGEVQWISDISREVGILSTPVIDLKTQTMYVVSRTKKNQGQDDFGSYEQKLHAIDILTGKERPNSPVVITAQVPGSGDGSVGGVLDFNPKKHNQRSALALVNGYVVICWASHNDIGPYHGWMMSYDAKTLKQKSVFCTTPNGGLGGIWMSGSAPAVDEENNLYVMTGNGTFDANTGGNNYGESILKIKLGDDGSLTLKDWFTPHNADQLNAWDADLGSAGVFVVPKTKSVAAGGKESVLYLLDRNKMGNFNAAGDTQISQRFQAGNGHIHGTPIYWEGPNGPTMYIWSEYDYLKAYRFNGTTFDGADPISKSVARVPDGMPGAFLSLSSNGAKARTGIIWANHPRIGNANNAVVPGILRAYDATDLNKELWNSEMQPARDRINTHAKFTPPTVANGKVYLPTFSNSLLVYGLFKALPPTGLNAGGDKVARFKSDAGFTGGLTQKTTSAIDVSGVPNPAPQDVYQTCRMGDCRYIVTGLTPGGDYTLRLHFAHISLEQPASNVEMRITVNGVVAIDKFSPLKEAGARNKAVIKTVGATADASGNITVLFRRLPGLGSAAGSVNAAAVNANAAAIRAAATLPIGSNRGAYVNGIEVVRGKP